jgi:predicted nucleic acid-binding protein
MRAFIDSDILIWQLRGEKKAQELLRHLTSEGMELWTGALQRMEVVFFMKPEEEKETRVLLARLKTQPVTQEIVDKGGEYYRKWNPSHGLDENDAILAASADLFGGRIYTLNIKHFPMPHVVSVKGW